MTDSYLLHNGTRVFTDSSERPSMASFMLAYFSAVKGKKKVLEMCSGSGIVSFWNYDRGFCGKTVMVDIRSDQLKLADMTASANGLDVETVNGDASSYRSDERFDAVICNPPFYNEQDQSADPDKKAFRHENGLDPDSLFRTALQTYLRALETMDWNRKRSGSADTVQTGFLFLCLSMPYSREARN